jgi:hypothetical protein
MSDKLKEFLEQLKEVDRKIEELEDLRESLHFRIDEELETGENLID